jgi:flagellar biosynthetic protein FliP
MENMLADFNLGELSSELRYVAIFTALSVIPILLVSLTTFTRNIVVLAIMRHALGLQQTPPNIVLISLALIITFFTMQPVFDKVYSNSLLPYANAQISAEDAAGKAWQEFEQFMSSQTDEADVAFVYEMKGESLPNTMKEVSPGYLIPAFLLSELKTAFKIGFIIYLPFLLVDLVVASILMSLGMIMVPPITLSLPLKIMLFVIIDGWALVAQTLVSSAVT